MTQDLKCSKCQGEMVQGFIPDYAPGFSKYVTSWVEGSPKRSSITYTRVPIGGGVPIAAFRCKGCGYLQFYADENFAAE
jgi:hypothetical protein